MNPKELVEPKVAAEMLHISTATITRAKKMGAPVHPVTPSGRKYRVYIPELLAWFQLQAEEKKEAEAVNVRPAIYELRAARRAAIG